MPGKQIRRSTHGTYTAAVVEYNSKFGPNSIYENTANIVDVITSPDIEDVDIIVFPECCINEANMPVPITTQTNDIPCFDENASSVVRNISCAVIQAHTYVVVDIMMKAECSLAEPCSENMDYVVYNTAVVFDRSGAIIAK